MHSPLAAPMIPAMNTTLRHVLDEASGIAGDAARLAIGAPLLPFALPAALAGVAAFGAVALGTELATKTGRAVLGELRRRARLRAPRPPSPSLRGTPTPKELAADAAAHPRTLAIRLRLGSRLADLAPTLDSGNRWNVSSAGAKRIAGRGRGVRGWLADNRVPVNYGTLMRYKRLAVRLRALLELDERIPLEWLLPGAAPTLPVPAELHSEFAAAKRRLGKLLRAHWNFSRLAEHVDRALGLTRLPRPRRGGAVRLDDTLLENTKRELAGFLQATGLPPGQEALRRRAVGWLCAESGAGSGRKEVFQ